MSFRWYIYYCSVCGGCAAYVGWALGRVPPIPHHVFQAAVKGMFLGMMLAVGLTLVDALWHLSSRSQAEGLWRVFVAGLVGTVGGFLGGLLGQGVDGFAELRPVLVIGWAITGLLIGASPGAYDLLVRLSAGQPLGGAGRKIVNGLLGGAVGGVLGGLLYLALRGLWGA